MNGTDWIAASILVTFLALGRVNDTQDQLEAISQEMRERLGPI